MRVLRWAITGIVGVALAWSVAAGALVSDPAGAAKPASEPMVMARSSSAIPQATAPPAPAAPTESAPAPPVGVAPVVAAAADPEPAPQSPPPAPSPSPPAPSPSPFELAVASIAYPSAGLGYEIVAEPGRRGIWGRTTTSPKRIVLYVRPTQTTEQIAFVLAHEIGHAVDLERVSPEERAEWRAARGIDAAAPWYGCDDCDDLSTPAGDFAESFAAWQAGARYFGSRLGPPPDDAQLALLDRIARD